MIGSISVVSSQSSVVPMTFVRRPFFAFICLLAHQVACQAPPPSIEKSTYAISDQQRVAFAIEFIGKYTGLKSTTPSGVPPQCKDGEAASSKCSCGFGARMEAEPAPFGLHGVLAFGANHSRAEANGGITVRDIEDVFSDRIGDWSQFASSANVRAWSDYHTQFFRKDGLDSVVKELQSGGIKFHSGWWTAEGSQKYYSVLFHVPNTQIVIEVWSDSCSTCGSYAFEERRQRDAKNMTKKLSGYVATQVSRAVDDLSIIVSFYNDTFGIDPVLRQTLSDGSEFVDFNFGDMVDIRYFKRTGQSGARTTDWFQRKLVQTGKSYMTNIDSCWPIWGDNHFGYSWVFETKDVLSKACKSSFGCYYKPYVGPDNLAYLLEPSGWQIQLNGNYDNVPSRTQVFDSNYCKYHCKADSSMVV